MNIDQIKRIFFIGIGGIGMSAVARYFNGKNVEIFGYDKTETQLTKTLQEEGMSVHYVDDLGEIPKQVDMVIYTPAIPKDHKQLNYFINNNFLVLKRAEILGLLSKDLKTIAVAGTHGKTTTSSILTHLLREGGFPCTAFLGGIAGNFDSNFVAGTNDWMVVEADEFDRSFLQLHPDMAVITAMDPDHLDIYSDGETMVEAFHLFAEQIKENGILYLQNNLKLNRNIDNINIEKYGLNGSENTVENIRVENGYFVFDYAGKQRLESLQFSMPGHHNVENAAAAISVALKLGVKEEDIRKALINFKGIKRRFECLVKEPDFVFIDDYAHHPGELKVAIHAAKTLYPDKKITGVFQPHLYSRTKDFVDGFAEELDVLDEIYLLDIYPARELPIPGVTSKIIFEKMKNPEKKLLKKENLVRELNLKNVEVLLTLGAGDIDKLLNMIKDKYLINKI